MYFVSYFFPFITVIFIIVTMTNLLQLELRTQKFIQHNSQRLNASNNANLLL